MANFTGDNGPNTIVGTSVSDQISGLDGNDILDGAGGDDVLIGGSGTDTLTGGTGADSFRDTAANFNGDRITDFLIGDRIQFTDLTAANANIHIEGSNLVYNGGSIQIDNLGPGRFVLRDITGGGIEVRLQSPAQNDFNGDGRSDVLLVHDNGTLIDWLGTSNGTFSNNDAAATYALPSGWHVSDSGDFDGDGLVDVLLRNDNGSITEWLGQTNGGFSWNSAATYGLDNSWKVGATGDFNGDGRADVLLVNVNGSVTNWLGQPDGTFFSNHAAASYALPAGWTVAGAGDFNGDGIDDVLLRNTNGSITEWLGKVGGAFAWNSPATYGLDSSWHVGGTGDFNGDGRADVLLVNVNGSVTNWLGQADGTFLSNHATASYVFPAGWHAAEIGDFNGDAIDDLLLRHDNGSITEWLGQGNGAFSWNADASYGLSSQWHVQPPHDLV